MEKHASDARQDAARDGSAGAERAAQLDQKPGTGPLAKAAFDFMMTLKPILGLRQPYVPAKLLKRHKVAVRRLNPLTGEVRGAVAEQYIQPVPPATMNQWLSEMDHWRKGKLDLEPLGDDGKPCNPPFLEALHFWHLIRDTLWPGKKDIDPGEIDPTYDYRGSFDRHTQWQGHDLGQPTGKPSLHSLFNRRSQRGANWQVVKLLHQTLPATFGPNALDWELDRERPHKGVVLLDEVPIKENAILVSELTTILLLALVTCRTNFYSAHRVYPVTVVTLSNRRARVIQGIVDFKLRTVEIRLAPPVDFMQGIQNANMTMYLATLGWLVGKPAGQTKEDKDVWEAINTVFQDGMSFITKMLWG